MKNVAKKVFGLLLVSIICFGVVFGVKAPVSAATYIYNWGERGTVATYLSDYAEDFYADNNTSYAELAALAGGSTEKAIPSSALYKQLHNLMESNHDYKTSYDATKSLFKYTDCQNGGGKISSFYSGMLIGPEWGNGWNREHTWPNSKGNDDMGENDLMMLRPTSTSENSSRGNDAYGQSSGYYNPNSESNGKYDLRGDVARIVLYMFVRWEYHDTNYNTDGIFGINGIIESQDVLLDWMEADPVDTWELGRNDAAESILGTRNVFVDYPELAFLLFNEEIPEHTTPSGNAENAGTSFVITAQSNNTSWGTVAVSGKTINATPKTGYEVSGYEILSGTATVTRSGNAFGVSATSDVKIQINFAPRSQKTVSFSQDGVISSQTAYSGDSITLPAFSGTLPDGITFVGWAEQETNESTEMPQYYTASSKYTVTANVTLYALYSKTVSDGGTSSNVFEKYTGALTEGDYIITFEGGAMKAESTGKDRLKAAEVDDSGNEIIVTDALIIWRLAKNGNYWTFYNESTGKYAAGTNVNNKATLISNVTDFAKWTASGNSTYEFVNLGNSSNGKNPLLRNNTDAGVGFACYATNTNIGGANTLYKRASGTVYYFTQLTPSCEHEYTADCDSNCNLCDKGRNAPEQHNFDENEICTNCGFDMSGVVVGDTNSDGKINNKDLTMLMQYINKWNVAITVEASDTNGDGRINNKDYTLLMQYVNKWNVELAKKS